MCGAAGALISFGLRLIPRYDIRAAVPFFKPNINTGKLSPTSLDHPSQRERERERERDREIEKERE